LSNELSPNATYFLDFDHSLDVEVSQADEWNENCEDELKDVSEPEDVVRVEAKLGSFHHMPRYIGLKIVRISKMTLRFGLQLIHMLYSLMFLNQMHH
jgi:hypothetical protein